MGGQGAQRHQIDRDGVGSVLGEMSMITGHPCSADVIATTPVEAFVLPTDAFELLREGHPEIEIALSQLVSDRLGHQSRDALCGKSLGGFRLQRCISSGAMGVVYAAINESDATPRALKMLRHRFIYSPEVISRFDQEADLLRQLNHPHVVSLRGHFVAYRTRFIVLDLYDGADLREVLRRSGPMPEATARAVLGQIATGLRYAHQQGVLHLDLKPANVLVDRRGKVAISDFGLGRLIESDGCDQEVVGTPLYMPPEQFTMTDVGPHCDWYAFGCIACELLTGERLFQSTSSRFMDQKLTVPSSSWPVIEASEELQLHIRTALQPLAEHRDLDLEAIARWARPVPELAAVLGETPSFH
jgi:serine/threonine protein kinase